MSNGPAPHRIVLIGLGSQGAGIVDDLAAVGHTLLAVVDVGSKVGRPVRSFTTRPEVPDLQIVGDLDAALDAHAPELLIISAALPKQAVLELAARTLRRGVNVLTLQEELLSRDDQWAAPLSQHAHAGGASFLATGVQDTFWVQLPAIIAAASTQLASVELTSTVPIENLSKAIGDEIGLGLTRAQFDDFAAAHADQPSVLGGPLRECARLLGYSTGPAVKELVPHFEVRPYDWRAGDTVIPPECTSGFRETVTFRSDDGVRFTGSIAVIPADAGAAQDEIHLGGFPEITVLLPGFPGHAITNSAAVARIPDVVAAPPGVLFSAELPPARHQRRRTDHDDSAPRPPRPATAAE